MTEWRRSGGSERLAAICSTAWSIPVGGSTMGGGVVETSRAATTLAATCFSPTDLGVTITLLTSLPVRGSDRTTDVMRLEWSGASAASEAPASRVPTALIEQKRIKMFSNAV